MLYFIGITHVVLKGSNQLMRVSRGAQVNEYYNIIIILVWPTQLDPALRTLFVCVYVCFCVSTSSHRTSSYVIYVISRQIVVERRVM